MTCVDLLVPKPLTSPADDVTGVSCAVTQLTPRRRGRVQSAPITGSAVVVVIGSPWASSGRTFSQ